MGLLLASATSDSPSVTPLFTIDYPFTVGCWVRPDAATGVTWTFTDNVGFGGATMAGLLVNTDWSFAAAGTGGFPGAEALTTTNVTVGVWYFVICRGISSTNRRIAVLNSASGLVEHGQSTVPRSISAATILVLNTEVSGGSLTEYDQALAEFWYTATDIQADGAQLLDSTMRQLAYGGPFSVPHIACDVLEYHSLRSSLLDQPVRGETYASGDPPVWTGAGIRTEHPPLPYWYMAPPSDTLNVSMMMF